MKSLVIPSCHLYLCKAISRQFFAGQATIAFNFKPGVRRIKNAAIQRLVAGIMTFLSFEFSLAHAEVNADTKKVPSACNAGVASEDTPAEPPQENPGSDCDNGKVVYRFTDDFERKDAATLGNGWLDCHSIIPDNFEPLGIRDKGVVLSTPFTRPGTYDPDSWKKSALEDGDITPGIGCAVRETGSKTISVKVIWSGFFGVRDGPPVLHVEGSPLLYVTPNSTRYGFGAWTTELYNTAIILVGYIGSPPEKVEIVASAELPGGHINGTPREVELRAERQGMVTVWVDGEQISLSDDYGLKPVEVDPAMINSTLHGIAVDAHLVYPRANIPIVKSIESVTIETID